MTDNAFIRAMSPSPDLAVARACRDHLFAKLDTHAFLGAARDELAREVWAETAVMAHHLAHDQGLADIAAAIPRATVHLSDWDPFFVSIARLAQSPAEPPVNADTLGRHGLLPSSCALTIDDFHYGAAHLVASLDQGNASCTRHAMQTLTATCTFTPDTAAALD